MDLRDGLRLLAKTDPEKASEVADYLSLIDRYRLAIGIELVRPHGTECYGNWLSVAVVSACRNPDDKVRSSAQYFWSCCGMTIRYEQVQRQLASLPT
ncbi:hypothetical protein [Nocardia thraciensis]